MLPHFTRAAANASSIDHEPGHLASKAVSHARRQVATLAGVLPAEVVFTSGATEANNIAIIGMLHGAAPDSRLVISAVEHPAVREAARRWGDRLRVVRIDADGHLDLDDLDDALRQPAALVSVMTANNETGAIQPIGDIAALCTAAGVPLHTDAAQAAGRLPLANVVGSAAMISLSAHKMYGPQGIGALIIRRSAPRARPRPLQYGGGHERGLRPGTLNVPGIVGFGAAADLVVSQGAGDWERERALGRTLREALTRCWPSIIALGDPTGGLPQTLQVRVPGVDSARSSAVAATWHCRLDRRAPRPASSRRRSS